MAAHNEIHEYVEQVATLNGGYRGEDSVDDWRIGASERKGTVLLYKSR